jgi:hypothetical protein
VSVDCPCAPGGKEKSTGKAVLHQYFAATGGDERGQMAMAYRHLHGRVGTYLFTTLFCSPNVCLTCQACI